MTFKYDPFGRRIQKSGPSGTTNYLYDGDNLLEELDNSGNLLGRYAQQSIGVDQPLAELRAGVTAYYEADGLGSITSLSNTSGALANTYSYDSYGNVTASTGSIINPFQYTGREFDSEAGNYFYRARYYGQTIGRFFSEDPMHFDAGINFYPYVNNSPVRNADPFGLATCTFYVTQGWLLCWPDQPGHDAVSIPVASGNNGSGMRCKNNPSCDPLHDHGPIPTGWWQWTTSPTAKPNGRVLVPMPGTLDWGRELIRSHSCQNAFGRSVSSPFCSTGCVTGSPDDIRQLNGLIDSEPGSKMHVVP